MSDQLEFSRQGFPASHTRTPGTRRAQAMTVRSGTKCIGLSKQSGHLGLFLRTCLASPMWVSRMSYLTWTPLGTRQRVSLFRLVPRTPGTGEIGSGLFPTPTSRDYKGHNSPEHLRKKKGHTDQLPNFLMVTVGVPLHPTFAEWAMGFPVGWTDSSHWGTPSSHK